MSENSIMTDQEIFCFIEEFESTAWPFERWHHREHLVMATWYLSKLNEKESIEKIRSGIIRYNKSKGIPQKIDSGYHDSITIFLAKGISAYLGALPINMTLIEKTQQVIDQFSDFKTIAASYYSAKLFDSWPARKSWIAPDLKPFELWIKWCRGNATNKRNEGLSIQ